jgi:hypothetical protein
VRSNTATAWRVRLVIVLSVTAAVTVMLGVILVAASVVIRILTKGQPANMARLGLDMVAAGIAFGLVVLVVFAIARLATAGGPRTSAGGADHRQETSRPQPAASHGPGKSPGHGGTQGNGKERLRAGAPPAGGGRFARPLNPTNVYTPGGLIDVPRDGRAPGTPGSQAIPEILRDAGPPPAPGASSPGAPVPGAQGGWGQDRHSSAWARTPPQPRYQPGMHPGGPGRGPYPSGGQPPSSSLPPRGHMRPQEAPWPGHAMPPPREPVPPREPGQPREPRLPRGAVSSRMPRPAAVGSPRDSGLHRDAGPPREGMGPGGPIRPAGPLPPRDPAYPPPGLGSRQGSGAGGARHAGGAAYAAPGGNRPLPGYPGPGGPAEASEQFDGGYAKVIRASDHPFRPSAPARPAGFGATGGPGRPAGPGRLPDPVRPAAPPADVYVYRDTDGMPDDSGPPAPGPDENDPAYWYDLPVTGPAGSDQPGGVPNVPRETRGPFEPLVSSAGPAPDAAHPAGADPAGQRQEGHIEDASHARKLEQIRNLYLTAEAIGEANVDKHFDQLLAQQRELISEYFKRPATAGDPAGLAEDDPGGSRPPGGPAGPPEGARVAADQPRGW